MKTIMKHDLLTTIAICRFNSASVMYGNYRNPLRKEKPVVKKGKQISEETRLNLILLAGDTLHTQIKPSPERI